MNSISSLIRRFWPGRLSPAAAVGGEAAFARLRIQLTLWYTAVLAGMLLLFGILLYLGAQQMLLGPVKGDLIQQADAIKRSWQAHPDDPCPPPVITSPNHTLLAVCFDQQGAIIIGAASNVSTSVDTFRASPFVTNPLFNQAVQHGSATDTINCGHDFGDVYRYAEVVPDQSGNGILGVVQVGELIGSQENTLQLLLTLLLILGATTLIGAALGGFWLAKRALAPAQLAFARQQAFIADASHELRTPLTLLRTNAEVLLRGRERLDPDDTALLEDIVTETGHMTGLANHMLTLARLDAGAAHLEREVVDLGALAAEIAHRARALAQEKQVTLHVEPAGQALVIGDRLLLEQAALILLDNAIKYNRQGGEVHLRSSLAQGQARLEVVDTGIGMAPEHLPHLGERFYRVDKARSREAGGAGLGLSIARSIATTHHGALSFASVPGQGTTATLTLPAATSAGK